MVGIHWRKKDDQKRRKEQSISIITFVSRLHFSSKRMRGAPKVCPPLLSFSFTPLIAYQVIEEEGSRICRVTKGITFSSLLLFPSSFTYQRRSHIGPKAGGSLNRSNFLMSSRLWISGERPVCVQDVSIRQQNKQRKRRS